MLIDPLAELCPFNCYVFKVICSKSFVCVREREKERLVKLVFFLHSEDILILVCALLFVNHTFTQNCGTDGLLVLLWYLFPDLFLLSIKTLPKRFA